MFFFAFIAFLPLSQNGVTVYTSHSQVNRLSYLKGNLITMSSGGICMTDSSGQNILINNSTGLLDNDVMDVVLDGDENIFAGSSNGITVFSNDLSRYLQLTSYFQGLPHGRVKELELRNDSLWAGSENGCWFWNTGGEPFNFSSANSSKFLSGEDVSSLLLYENNLFVGSIGQLVKVPTTTYGDTSTYTVYSKGLSSQDTILSVVIFKDTIWISTNSQIKILIGDSFVSGHYSSRRMRLSSLQDSLFVNDYDNYAVRRWVNGSWEQYGPGLPSRPVSVSVDSEGKIYCGTENSSNYYYSSNSWNQDMPPGLFKPLASAAAMLPNGIIAAVHFGNDYSDAVSLRYPDGEWKTITSLNYDTTGDWGAGKFISVRDDSSFVIGVWGRPGGLIFLYPGASSQDSLHYDKLLLPYTPSGNQQPISAMHVDPNGDVWCASFDNQAPYLFRVKPDNSVESFFNNLFIYTYSICMLKDGRVAFGTAHLNSNGFTAILNPEDSSVTSEVLELSGNDINAIDNYKGDLIFIGSNGGINTFDVSAYQVIDTITSASTQGGLIGSSVVSLLHIPGNGLWALCQNAGLSHRKEDSTWEKFEYPDVLPGIPVGNNRGGLFYQPDTGLLLVPTSNGLCLFPIEADQTSHDGEMFIYPNPWRLDCSLTIETTPGDLFVYSLDGNLVFQTSSANGNFVIQEQSLDEIASGLYFVISKSGDSTARGRLVIVR
ncbi:T9SS type A sorting domain-containing protein [candidate division WOR-3 bacterium]|nr:T9SS type A sorting domain-containing protein [candidate division WOR-3 bacterium]